MGFALPAGLVTTLLVQLLKLVTPTLREELEDFLKKWYVKAKQSPSKWDDVAAAVVTKMLSVDTSAIVVPPVPGQENVPNELVDAVAGGVLGVVTGVDPFLPPGYRPGIDSP